MCMRSFLELMEITRALQRRALPPAASKWFVGGMSLPRPPSSRLSLEAEDERIRRPMPGCHPCRMSMAHGRGMCKIMSTPPTPHSRPSPLIRPVKKYIHGQLHRGYFNFDCPPVSIAVRKPGGKVRLRLVVHRLYRLVSTSLFFCSRQRGLISGKV